MADREPLLCLVGRRSGALEGARAAGAHAILVAPRPPRDRRARLQHYVAWSPEEGVAALPRLAGELRTRRPAAVIPLAERTVRLAAALARELNVPGVTMDCAMQCTDKALMKAAVSSAGLPSARLLDPRGYRGAEHAIETLGLPLVIKHRVSSGGRGFRLCNTAAEVPRRLAEEEIAESYIDGTEMSVESLVAAGHPVWTNFTEYLERQWANVLPLELADRDRDAVLELNRRAIAALGVRQGMTHLELFLTPAGPVFGELACRPPGGYLMPLIRAAYGFDPWAALFDCWLAGRPTTDVPAVARQTAGVRLLHPGPGHLESIRGLAQATAVPGITAVKLRCRPGDRLRARAGSGEDVGQIHAVGPHRAAVAGALAAAEAALHLDIRPI